QQDLAPVHSGKGDGDRKPEKAVDDLYEAFLRYSNLPMLESKQVLLNAIAQGVREKVFGVRIGDRTFFGENVLSQLGAGAIVVREPELPPESPSGTGGGTTTLERPTQGTQEDGSPRPGPSTPVIREYKLEVVVPWDRLYDFVSGVIRPPAPRRCRDHPADPHGGSKPKRD
ncbi:MAG: hypothetical protein NZ960_06860, partial [Candidatus Kapabacteria bacterium]|nr:hypothetical protein [Candidatus Kapabacteria bacterium]